MSENLGSFRVPEKIYFKKGCLPVALEELKYVYHKQKVLIVASPELHKQGRLKPVTDKLNELGIVYAIHDVYAGMTNAVKIFEPDCMLTFYEYDWDMIQASKILMAMKKKIYFVAVPCLLGTHSQVLPLGYDTNNNFADMVIIDIDLMSANINNNYICWAMDPILNLAMCACESENATDYSDSMAIRAIQLIFAYLPEILENPVDNTVLEKLESAGTMAEIAFFNARADFEKLENYVRCAELLNMDLEIFKQKLEDFYQLYLKFN
ncbi:MAG: iron-containing alcohol dehydrogenase [Oscillospiraceae bacterium]|nr:iron-containing alcohol dehydrogenase [Oscillospiraceae bacterium]